MPFANATGDAKNDVLALRLGQKTTDYLGKYGWLRAVGTGGAAKNVADPIAAARNSAADYVVTAKVVRRGFPARTFHVDDAQSGARLWSQTLAPILEARSPAPARKKSPGARER